MEDTHTGARVERVKSFVSLYTVHSLLAVESWATCVHIAKLDLLTVVHINELLLHMFFNVFWKVARPCALFKCTFHVHFGPSISELYCTVPYNVTPESNIKVIRIKEMITNQRLLNKFSLSAPYTVWRTVWRIYILMIGCKGFKGTFN